MAGFRSLLFVPGNRPERFGRAIAAGADAVCLDLEDAVPPKEKDLAREAAARFLADRPTATPVGIRINALDTPWSEADLSVLAQASFVMVPKTASPDQLAGISETVKQTPPLWPLVETAEGLRQAWDIAAASCVQGVLFGAFDYAADVGCTTAWEALLFARSQLAAACARARVDLLDAPCGDLHDSDLLAHSTSQAKALGFTGRACIHPNQVPLVNAVFTPSDAEVARARRMLAAFEVSDGVATQMDGELVELPLALAARRVLARARG